MSDLIKITPARCVGMEPGTDVYPEGFKDPVKFLYVHEGFIHIGEDDPMHVFYGGIKFIYMKPEDYTRAMLRPLCRMFPDASYFCQNVFGGVDVQEDSGYVQEVADHICTAKISDPWFYESDEDKKQCTRKWVLNAKL